MKFLFGFVTGVAVGAIGAVVYSVQSGRDLREAFEDVREDLNKRDMDALGQRLETGFSQIQAQIDERIAQVREKTAAAGGQASTAAVESVAAAADAAASATEGIGEAAEQAGEAVADAAAPQS